MQILQEYHWPGNIRELENLVESMVVLAPGREVLPEDIPRRRCSGLEIWASVRWFRSGREAARRAKPSPSPGIRPELEFIFRDPRRPPPMDVDDLKQEFEVYRNRSAATASAIEAYTGGQREGARSKYGRARKLTVGRVTWSVSDDEVDPASAGRGVLRGRAREPVEEPGTVVYRSGMTMEDLERGAIAVALGRGARQSAEGRPAVGDRRANALPQDQEVRARRAVAFAASLRLSPPPGLQA